MVGGPARGAPTGPLNERRRAVYCRATVNAADDIAEFLATRRAKLTPEQVGLPSYGKRRVPGPAPRGGRVAGRRQRRLLPAPGARPGQRRLGAGARGAGPRAPARRRRARASLRPGARRESGRAEALAAAQDAHPPRRAAPARPDRSGGDRQHRPRRLPGGQRARPRAVRAGLRQPRAAGQQRAVHLPGPGGARLLPRLGAAGHRARRGVALAGRAQPLRPQSSGPHRRAVDAQRRVPGPLGGAQRALPPDRHQAPASPDRRRAGAQLRDADARRRRRPAHGALHRRSRLGLAAGARPAGELDGNPRPIEKR